MLGCTSRSLNSSAMHFRNMKHMQKRLRNDELRVLRGEVEVDETQLESDVADLETSASEDDLQPARQAPADFVSVKETRSMQTTNKGTRSAPVWPCLLPHSNCWLCIADDIELLCQTEIVLAMSTHLAVHAQP